MKRPVMKYAQNHCCLKSSTELICQKKLTTKVIVVISVS